MTGLYLTSFILAFLISMGATRLVARFAIKQGIVDVPDATRHLHTKPTPLVGGWAIFISFFLVSFILGIIYRFLIHGNIPLPTVFAIWLAGLVLMIGGYLDDKHHLPAAYSIIFPILATIIIIGSGIRAVSIHNPFGTNIILLMPLASAVVVFLWTMTLTYTTKLLDGMDGLVSGICAIGALVLFALSLTAQVQQPQTAFLAIIFAGSLLGFLVFNFYPAKIFLGESGSTFAGFMLAVLAIVSGGKIATALLIMGLPLLDMIWVVLRRLLTGQSPFSGDRKHLHFKLIELGLSERQTVLVFYFLTAIFGLSAIFLQSLGKLIALILLLIVMLAILVSVYNAFISRKLSYDK